VNLADSAKLALDTMLQKPTRGIPTLGPNIMEHAHLERLAAVEVGSYARDPIHTYLACQRGIGTNLIIQWIPENPLSMGARGFEGAPRGATTGASEVVLDGITIDSPEAVVEHMERFCFPALTRAAKEFDADARKRQVIEYEASIQELLGPRILKSPYGIIAFPALGYCGYGYANYFMVLALYPEVIERHFSLQADYCVLNNQAAADAYQEAGLPPLGFLDHDMADSRGTLVDVKMLDRIWFPHFARSLEPVLRTNIRLMWHCDGNLVQMVPRLIDAGVKGFQGFQYEDGMDYQRICRMRARDGDDLLIVAGVSVTRTLPLGTPAGVRQEMEWLVDNGPRTGLFLGASSSIAPGVPWENLKAFIEGLSYYRFHGRA